MEHHQEWVYGFVDGWEYVSPRSGLPMHSTSAGAEAGQQASTATSELASAVGQEQTTLRVDVRAGDQYAKHAASETISNGMISCGSGIGCDQWLQEDVRGNWTATGSNPQPYPRSLPPDPNDFFANSSNNSSPRANGIFSGSDSESIGDDASSNNSSPRAKSSASGIRLHVNAPALFSPPSLPERPLSIAPPPLPHRPPSPARLHLLHLVKYTGICRQEGMWPNENPVGGSIHLKNVSRTVSTSPNACCFSRREMPSLTITTTGAEEEYADSAAGAKMAAASQPVVSEGWQRPTNVMSYCSHHVPVRGNNKSFTYDYFTRLRMMLRCTYEEHQAHKLYVQHIAAITWLSHSDFDVTMPLDHNGVPVATYVKHDEVGVYFDASVKKSWYWPELIASIDDHTLLGDRCTRNYTPLQYIVNGPTWVENRHHSIGIMECLITSRSSVRIKRRDGSCAILTMGWADGQLQVNELGEVGPTRKLCVDIKL